MQQTKLLSQQYMHIDLVCSFRLIVCTFAPVLSICRYILNTRLFAELLESA